MEEVFVRIEKVFIRVKKDLFELNNFLPAAYRQTALGIT